MHSQNFNKKLCHLSTGKAKEKSWKRAHDDAEDRRGRFYRTERTQIVNHLYRCSINHLIRQVLAEGRRRKENVNSLQSVTPKLNFLLKVLFQWAFFSCINLRYIGRIFLTYLCPSVLVQGSFDKMAPAIFKNLRFDRSKDVWLSDPF